jgi:single-strand DNA-binding protein
MNSATFAGRVGADAELKYTQSGKAVADFNIAVDNGKDSEGQKRQPTWIKAVLWERKAEGLAQYIKKGSIVVVQGPVSTEAWISKQDGKPQSRIIVTVREFTFGGGAKENSSSAPADDFGPAPVAQSAPPQRASDPITDSDIPF